jgi:tRNA-dihydrouridine synthase
VLELIRQPLKIDQIATRNRVIQAPLSGISDLPFRQLAFEYGAGMVVTEMVASRELVCNSAESFVRMQGKGITPHVVQLAGREAKWMRDAAKICADSGADMIDINMGCPAKKGYRRIFRISTHERSGFGARINRRHGRRCRYSRIG